METANRSNLRGTPRESRGAGGKTEKGGHASRKESERASRKESERASRKENGAASGPDGGPSALRGDGAFAEGGRERNARTDRPRGGEHKEDGHGKHADPHPWLVDPETTCQVTKEEWSAALERARGEIIPRELPKKSGDPPEFILTLGAQGSGKSTVAMAYVERHGRFPVETYAHLDFDVAVRYHPRFRNVWSLPDVLGRRPGPGSARAWRLCDEALQGLLTKVAYELMDAGHNVVLQSHSPERLIEARERGYRTVCLFVGAPLGLCVERARSRALATGMFLAPTLETQRGHVAQTWNRLRCMAPYYATWADELAVVANGRPGVSPKSAVKDAVRGPPLDWALFGPDGEVLRGEEQRSPIRALFEAAQGKRWPPRRSLIPETDVCLQHARRKEGRTLPCGKKSSLGSSGSRKKTPGPKKKTPAAKKKAD